MTEVVGDFNPMMLVHGEQYLEWYKVLPTSGTLKTRLSVVDVVDKGKAVIMIIGATTTDSSGNKICYQEYSNFIRGVGGIGTKGNPDRGDASRVYDMPNRKPDVVVKEKTSPDQAALYRLSGDRNPLHIDPSMAEMGGFKQPILHGLCTFGIAGKHLYQTLCQKEASLFKSIKVRFAKFVFPGETLQTEMWKSDDGKSILFQVRVLERDTLALSGGCLKLNRPLGGKAKL